MSEKMIVACPECQTRFVAPLEKFLPEGRKVRCAKCGHAWFQRVDGSTTATPAPAPATPPTESIMDRATRVTSPSPSPSERTVEQVAPASANVEQETTSEVVATAALAGASAATATAASTIETREAPVASMPQQDRVAAPEKKRGGGGRFLFYSVAAILVAGALGYFFKDQIVGTVPALDPPLSAWKQTVDGAVSTVVSPNRSLRIENVKYDLDDASDEKALLLTADVVNESGSVKEAPKLTVTIYGSEDVVLEKMDLSPEDLTTEIAAEDRAPYFLRMPYPPEDLQRVEVDFAE